MIVKIKDIQKENNEIKFTGDILGDQNPILNLNDTVFIISEKEMKDGKKECN